MSRAGFARVSRKSPCPICGKPDWCMIAKTGEFAICPRVPEGAVKWLGEAGYLHKLTERNTPRRIPFQHQPPDDEPTIDAPALTEQYRERANDLSHKLELEAKALGVSTGALELLGIGWSEEHQAWAFPMSDGAGNVIGIRLRNSEGRKWAVRGSRSGLFLPSLITGDGPLMLVEGPTDAAALIDLDFDVIGRPFCRGGTQFLQDVLRSSKRDVVVVSDNDTPGIEGATALATSLAGYARSLKIIRPLKGKDVRAWKREGATKDVVMWVVRQANYWRAAA